MHNIGYLVLANVVIWGLFFFYLFRLQKSNSDLRKEIDLLKLEKKKSSSL